MKEDMDTKIILDIRDLSVHYNTYDGVVKAVSNLNLKMEKGKSLGLVGETGAGKTSTALAMLNLVPEPPGVIMSGEIFIDGVDILKLDTKELEKVRGSDISMIFQDPMTALNPVFTIVNQVAESILLHEKVSHTEAFERAEATLLSVGIPGGRIFDYPHQFSGGMKQRALIAIALARSPKILIADEPTTALDVTIQAQVLRLTTELVEVYDTSLLLITHDLGIVANVCDEVAVMYAGRIVEQGTLTDVFNRTKHPYTEGLFNSIPNIRDRKSKLVAIPGLMPDPTDLPPGCAFAPRCSYAISRCSKAVPDQRWISESHMVACFAYDDPSFHIDREAKDE